LGGGGGGGGGGGVFLDLQRDFPKAPQWKSFDKTC